MLITPWLRSVRNRRSSSRLAHRTQNRRHTSPAEILETRSLLAGPQLVSVSPNVGEFLQDGTTRTEAPRELTFQFSPNSIIDSSTASLAGIQIYRSGFDGGYNYSFASASSAFGTSGPGAVSIGLTANRVGSEGNRIQLHVTAGTLGASNVPIIDRVGDDIFITISNQTGALQTTAQQLIDALNTSPNSGGLITASLLSGIGSNMLPETLNTTVQLSGAVDTAQVLIQPAYVGLINATETNKVVYRFAQNIPDDHYRIELHGTDVRAHATSTFGTSGTGTTGVTLGFERKISGTGSDVLMTFSTSSSGPAVNVVANATARTISVTFNTSAGTTSANQLIAALAANAVANSLISARVVVGTGTIPISNPGFPATLSVTNASASPGLRNSAGEAFAGGFDVQRRFELDLGAQIVAVVPQPVIRTAGVLSQSSNQIQVYFNSDELIDTLQVAENPAFYQLVDTKGTATEVDDVIQLPASVSYAPGVANPGIATLTFATALPQGTYRLRIGTTSEGDSIAAEATNLGTLLGASPYSTVAFIDDDLNGTATRDDVDLYQFDLRSNGTISLSAIPDQGVDTAIRLFQRAANGTLNEVVPTASNYNGRGQTDLASWNLTVSQPTTYFVGVSSSGNTTYLPATGSGVGGGTTSGSYHLDIDFTPNTAFAENDTNTSYSTATNLGTIGSAGVNLSDFSISPQNVPIPPLPGGTDEPGHRDIQAFNVENHINSSGTTPVPPSAVRVFTYSFPDVYGTLFGEDLHNQITEEQKKLTREFIESFSRQAGVQFVEVADQTAQLWMITGDKRAVDVTLTPGGGISDGQRAIVDAATLGTDEDYGGGWMGVALQEFVHNFPFPHAGDLHSFMDGDPGASRNGIVTETFAGEHDYVHLRRQFPNLATDIDLYRFDVTETGLFTAEITAERNTPTSLLDSALTLFKDPFASASSDLTISGGPTLSFQSKAAGAVGNSLNLVFDKAALGTAGVPTVTVIGRDIFVTLDTVTPTTASQVVTSLNNVANASSQLITASFTGTDGAVAGFTGPNVTVSLAGGNREVIARNEDYNSNDAYLELELDAGVYYLGVTAEGNTDYDPTIPDTGFGGLTDGDYDLQLLFHPNSVTSLTDSDNTTSSNPTAAATAFDGDADGLPGGVFDFWFQSGSTVFVDKTYTGTSTGTITAPYNEIDRGTLKAASRIVAPLDGLAGIQDGEIFTIDDGPNPAKSFEFDFDSTITASNVRVALQSTNLTSDITSLTQTSLDVGSTAIFPAVDGDGTTIDFYIQVGSERMAVTNKTSTTLIVQRGFGTLPTLHTTGDRVVEVGNSAALVTAIRNAIEAQRTGGFLQTVATANTSNGYVDLVNVSTLDVSRSNGLITAANQVRVVGNGGTDGNQTTELDNVPYVVGVDNLNKTLVDGGNFDVPQGVTVVIDAGTVIKLQNANIDVGTSIIGLDRQDGAIQILGTPGNEVFLTSFRNDSIGGDSDAASAGAGPGQWGGVVLREDSDMNDSLQDDNDNANIFLNSIFQTDISYGGGQVTVNSVNSVFTPIHLVTERPTIAFNRITNSADAAISADPNSFDDSLHRIGPDIHGNVVTDNSINGLFTRIRTQFGEPIDKLDVRARFDDTDITHVITQNLVITGNPGGALNVNESQELSVLGGPTGGTFTLTLPSSGPTQPATSLTGSLGTGATTLAAALTAAMPTTTLTAAVSLIATTIQVANAPALGALGGDGDPLTIDYIIQIGSEQMAVLNSVAGPGASETLTVQRGFGTGIFSFATGATVTLQSISVVNAAGTLSSADSFDSSIDYIIQIDNEQIGVTQVTGDLLAVVRGFNGTTAAAHAIGAPVIQKTLQVLDSTVFPLDDGDPATIDFNITIGAEDLAVTDVIGNQLTVNRGINGTAPAIHTNGSSVSRARTSVALPYTATAADITAALEALDGIGPGGVRVTGGPLPQSRVQIEFVFAAGSQDIDELVVDNSLLVNGAVVNDTLTEGGVDTARLGGRLVIDPGIVVKLSKARIEGERGSSVLIAEGTAENPIIFTSVRDDRYGGASGFGGPNPAGKLVGTFDSASDGFDPNPENGVLAIGATRPLNEPNKGDWGGIIFGAGGRANFEYAVFSYAGGSVPIEGTNEQFNTIEVHEAELRVANSKFEFNDDGRSTGSGLSARDNRGGNDGAVIFARGTQPTILNNIFQNNDGSAISIDVNSFRAITVPDTGRATGRADSYTEFGDNQGPLVRLNRMANDITNFSGILGMEIRAGELIARSVWDDTDIVHVIESGRISIDNVHTETGLRIQSAPDASLVVKLGAGAGFEIGRPDKDNNNTLTAGDDGPADISDRIGGTLHVVGAPGFPVVLTAIKDDSYGASLDPRGFPHFDTNSDGRTTPSTAEYWSEILIDKYANDRNVVAINELEKGFTGGIDVNGSIVSSSDNTAQFIGALAPDDKSADENRRAGFEIHGAIANDDTTDVDVYSFTAVAGTEIWLDIDRTNPSLDTVLEFLSSTGSVLARSLDTPTDSTLPESFTVSAFSLQKFPSLGGDYYATTTRDSGMRLVTPGITGTTNTYFVRVRSTPLAGSINDIDGGLTSGEYQLQIRLNQRDEVPGTIVKFADIRYAQNGVHVKGLPYHSPLTGESGEDGTIDALNNSSTGLPVELGNMLYSDRASLSFGGNLTSEGDIDFYKFRVDLEEIQEAAGSTGGAKTWSTVIDLDWADGLNRPDTTFAIFRRNGQLVYIARESNIADDQANPAQGQDTDLTRGSLSVFDPFLGTAQLDVNASDEFYYLAVVNNQLLPSVLNAVFQSGSTNTAVRLEPVTSLKRIAEDHIGSIGYDSNGNQIDHTTTDANGTPIPLIDIATTSSLTAHVDPFEFEDVQLYIHGNDTLYTVDPLNGNRTTRLNVDVDPVGGNTAQDIVMRSDGKLFAYRRSNATAGTSGALVELETGTSGTTLGGYVSNVNDGIPSGPPPSGNSPILTPVGNNNKNFEQVTNTDDVDALAFRRRGVNNYDLFYSVRENGSAQAVSLTSTATRAITFNSKLYVGMPTGSAALGSTTPGGLATGVHGDIQLNGTAPASSSALFGWMGTTGSIGFQTRAQGTQANGVELRIVINGGFGFGSGVSISTSNGVVTALVNYNTDPAQNSGIGAAVTSLDTVINAINANAAASDILTAAVISGSGSTLIANSNVTLRATGGTDEPGGLRIHGNVTGLAMSSFTDGTLLGVTSGEGIPGRGSQLISIDFSNNGNARATIIRDFSSLNIGTSGGQTSPDGFQGLALGPQNVRNDSGTSGFYADKLFAVTQSGLMYAFDATGVGAAVFDSGNSTQTLSVTGIPAVGSNFTLSFDDDNNPLTPSETTDPIAYNAPDTIGLNEKQNIVIPAYGGTYKLSVLDNFVDTTSPVDPLVASTAGSADTFTVEDSTGFVAGSIIRVENEEMLLVSIPAFGTFNVIRGIHLAIGTIVPSHPDTATVYEVRTTTLNGPLAAAASTQLTGRPEVQTVDVRSYGDSSPTYTLSLVSNLFDTTTLAGAINASSSGSLDTITVASTAGFVADSIIRVENEEMRLNTIVGMQLNVTRGVHGTGAVAHPITASVVEVLTTTVASAIPVPTSSTLTAAVDNSAASDLISVVSPASFPMSSTVRVDNEEMLVLDNTTFAGQIQVTRATNGVLASHAIGSQIVRLDTTISVTDVLPFPSSPGFKIRIDSEDFLVTFINTGTNQFTILRGQNGTSPTVTHALNATVFQIVTTGNIAYNANAATVDAALAALVLADDASITTTGGPTGSFPSAAGATPATLVFSSLFGVRDVATVTADTSRLVGDEIQQIANISGGTFDLSFRLTPISALTPIGINLDSTTLDQATLQGLFDSALGAGNIIVGGGPLGTSTPTPFTVQYTGIYQDQDISDSALVITQNTALANFERQQLLIPSSVTGGTFTLSYTAGTTTTTSPIPFSATAAQIQARINADLTTLTAGGGSVVVTATQDFQLGNTFLIDFRGTPFVDTNANALAINNAALVGGTGVVSTLYNGNSTTLNGSELRRGFAPTAPVTTSQNGFTSIDSLATSVFVSVADTSGFPAGSTIRIDNEEMIVVDNTTYPDVLLVTRGANGTTRAAHPNNSAVSLLDQVINVVDVTPFPASTPPNFLIRIDSEDLLVTGVNTGLNQFTVRRGQNGTSAAAHADGATVSRIYTTGSLAFNAAAATVATTVQSTLTSNGITGTVTGTATTLTATLAGNLGAIGTTVTVGSTLGFPDSGRLRIDLEEMTYTGKNATQFLNLVRGVNGTTAASHSFGVVATASATSLEFSGLLARHNVAQLTVDPTGLVGDEIQTIATVDVGPTTTLTAAAAVGATTITVANTGSFPNSGMIRVGTETVSYTGKTGTTFTVLPLTQAHVSGETVTALGTFNLTLVEPAGSTTIGTQIPYNVSIATLQGLFDAALGPGQATVGGISMQPLGLTVTFSGLRQDLDMSALQVQPVGNFERVALTLSPAPLAPGGSLFRLTYATIQTGFLRSDISAALLQTALNGLSSIGPGGVSVTSTGGTLDTGATYYIDFNGTVFVDTDVSGLTVDNSNMFAGGTISANVLVAGNSNTFNAIETRKGISVTPASFVETSQDGVFSIRERLDALPSIASGDVLVTATGATGLPTNPVQIQFAGAYAGRAVADLIVDNFEMSVGSLATITTTGTFGDRSADSVFLTSNALRNANGLAFSPLDINLWHPTGLRGGDVGHGITDPADNTRAAVGGGTSMYFGFEDHIVRAYPSYESASGQLGVVNSEWQRDLTSNPNIATDAPTLGSSGTYNLPGGAFGRLKTNSISLAGYSANDKPTLYFNYFLDTPNTDGRDSARVFASPDGGITWELIATNSSGLDNELPKYLSHSAVYGEGLLTQQVQELFDTSSWRQARVDLSKYAGLPTPIAFRFDFATGGKVGETLDPTAAPLPFEANGIFSEEIGDNVDASSDRGRSNRFEGFFIDDIIVGFAERGEMVTNAPTGAAGTLFDDLYANPRTDIARLPAAVRPNIITKGQYQIEIRRGVEYAAPMNGGDPVLHIDSNGLFDTNDRLINTISNPQLISQTFDLPHEYDPNPLTFTEPGISDVPWDEFDASLTPTLASSPSHSFRSGTISAGQVSAADLVIATSAGNFSFTVFADTAAGNRFTFFIDGQQQTLTTATGTSPFLQNSLTFIQQSFPVTEGAHTFRWVYTKTGAAGTGTDAVYIDNISFPGTASSAPPRQGDQNVPREQGMIVIEGNFIRDVSGTGIIVEAGARDSGGATPTNAAYIGPVRQTPFLNNANRLVTHASVVNNVVAYFGAAGIRFSGDNSAATDPIAAVPMGKILNNTVYGSGAGVGIDISNNSSPTLMNNIIANSGTGIRLDASSGSLGSRTEWTTNLFQGNGANTSFSGGSVPNNAAVFPSSTSPLFVDPSPQVANFYLAASQGAANPNRAIDSSLDVRVARPEYTSVTTKLGIPVQNIFAPTTDRFGQLRKDDATTANTGAGTNVFIDLGAIDRVDFNGPTVQLVLPLDNGSGAPFPDLDMGSQYRATIDIEATNPELLTDFELSLLDVNGVGVNNSTINSGAFTKDFNSARLNHNRLINVTRNGLPFEEYQLAYNSNTKRLILTSLTTYELDSIYEIFVNRGEENERQRLGMSGIPIDGEITLTFDEPGVSSITTSAINVLTPTSVTFDSTMNFGGSFPAGSMTIRIDDELMTATAVGNTLIISARGVLGTTPTTHQAGLDVFEILSTESTIAGALPYNATATQFQNALESLTALNIGDIAVTGGPLSVTGTFVDFEFTGNYAIRPVPQLRVTETLTPTSAVVVMSTLIDGNLYGTRGGVRDIAGNRLQPNQINGTTQFSITVTNGQNDAPVVGTLPIQTLNEEDTPPLFGSAFTFSTANNNVITISDPDAFLLPGSLLQVTLSTIGASGQSGTLALADTLANLGLDTSNFNDANGVADSDGTDGTLVIRGTLAALNFALNGLRFTPRTDFVNPNGDGTANAMTGADDIRVTVTVNDLGNYWVDSTLPITSPDPQISTPSPVLFKVIPANDTPEFTLPTTFTVDEDATAANIVTAGGTGFAPASAGPVNADDEDIQTLTYTITQTGLTGNLAFLTPPDIDETTGNLTFVLAPDTNGTATFSVTLADDGVTGSPAVADPKTSAAQSFTIVVNAVNDPPVNSYNGASTFPGGILPALERTDFFFNAANMNQLSVNDLDAIEALIDSDVVVVTIKAETSVSAVATGKLTLTTTSSTVTGNGSPSITIRDTVANVNNLLSELVFLPGTGFTTAMSGEHVRITMTTDDEGRTGSGATTTDSDFVLLDVREVNDAPTLSVPGPQMTDEDGATIVLSGANAPVVGEDLMVDPDPAVSGAIFQVTVEASHGVLSLGSLTGIDFSFATDPDGSPDGNGIADPKLTFRGTVTDINNALDGLTYLPNGDFNSNLGTESVVITVNDRGHSGQGGSKVTSKTIPVTVRPTNDNPSVLAPTLVNAVEDTTFALGAFSFVGADSITITEPIDGDNGGNYDVTVTVASTGAKGQVRVLETTGAVVPVNDASVVTLSGTLTQINAALAGMLFQPPPGDNIPDQFITIDVDDNGNDDFDFTPQLPGTDTIQVIVDGDNDAPEIDIPTPSTRTLDEDVPAVYGTATGNAITISDIDAGAGDLILTITSTNGQVAFGTTSGLTSFKYETGKATAEGNLAALNSALNGLTFDPTDNFVGTANITINVNDKGNTGRPAVNDPKDAVPQTLSVTYTALNDAPTITPQQSPLQVNEDSKVTISSANNNGILVGDVDIGTGQPRVTMSVSKGKLTLSRVTGLTFGSGTANGSSKLIFVGTSLAPINAAIENMVYQPNDGINGSDTLVITVDDQGFTGPGPAGVTTVSIPINIQAINDAPVLAVPSAQSTNEDTGLVFSSGKGNAITISDLDVNEGTGRVEITLTTTNGVVNLGTASNTVVTAGANGSSTVTFNAAIADANVALSGLTYVPTAEYSGSAKLDVAVSDLGNTGTGNILTASTSISISVAAQNDAPVNSVPTTTLSVLEDNPLSLNGMNTISVSDVDSGSSSIQVTLTATNGKLSVTPGAGVAGNNSSTVTLTGSAASINTVLASLVYLPSADFNGSATITVATNDNGFTGGSARTDSDAVAITVISVNDLPVGVNDTYSVIRGNTLTTTDADGTSDALVGNNGVLVNDTDVDTARSQWRAFLSVPPTHHVGSFTLNQNGTFNYIHDGMGGSTDTFTYQIFDGVGINPTDVTVTININDAPVIADPGTVVLNENASVGTTVVDINATDANVGNVIAYSLVGGNTNGAFSIDSATGVVRVANASALNFEVNPTFTLTVQATDNATTPASSSRNVLVNLNDLSEAVSIGSTLWTNAGLTVKLDGGGTLVRVVTTGTDTNVFEQHVLANVASLSFTGRASANDRLTIDFTNGNPIPTSGLSYNGGTAGNDSLELVGGSGFDTIAHNFASASSGTISLTGGSKTSVVSYSGLEPIVDSLGAANRVFTYGSANDSVTLRDGSGSGDGRMEIVAPGTGESVEFASPTASLTIALVGGNDVFSSTAIDSVFSGALTILAGDGNDNVTLGLNIGVSVDGGTGDDVIIGGNGADSLQGSSGKDIINGGAGNDVVNGGANDDRLTGGLGDDEINGQGSSGDVLVDTVAGVITLTGSIDLGTGVSAGTLASTAQSDVLTGIEFVDITGSGGADTINFANWIVNSTTINGAGGDDIITGSPQRDEIRGSEGNDRISAGDGNDAILGGEGNDVLNGNGGTDFVDGEAGNDTVQGGAGNDTLSGGSGADLINGQGSSNDVLRETLDPTLAHQLVVNAATGRFNYVYTSGGSTVTDSVIDVEIAIVTGGNLADRIDMRAWTGPSTVAGGSGNDVIFGGTGLNRLGGNAGNDKIVGNTGVDQIFGDDGDDSIDGGAGNDALVGGVGNDTINGRAGNDKLYGEVGTDVLLGGIDNDVISGGDGNDQIVGEAGDDTVRGDNGSDTMTGGGNGVARSTNDLVVMDPSDVINDVLQLLFTGIT